MPYPKAIACQYKTFVAIKILLQTKKKKLQGKQATKGKCRSRKRNISDTKERGGYLQLHCNHRHKASLACHILFSSLDHSKLFKKIKTTWLDSNHLLHISLQLYYKGETNIYIYMENYEG